MESDDSVMSEPAAEAASNEPSVTDKSELKTFICVEYPGCVKNNDNAIATLGGMKTLSDVSFFLSISFK